MVELDGLENRCAGNRTEGSNPSPSAKPKTYVGVWRSSVARTVRDGEVAGSNPVTPTMKDARHLSGIFHGGVLALGQRPEIFA